MKRSIRLKEKTQKIKIHTPALDYLKIRPTLKKETFYEHTSDERGFSNEVTVKSENTIFLVGGSFIENVYSQLDCRISSTLLKKFALNQHDINIINAGVSGMTSIQALNLILNKLIKKAPKHIIVFIPPNDGHCVSLEDGLWNKNKTYSNLIGIDNVSKISRNNEEEKVSEICNIYSLIAHTCDLFNIGLTVCASPIVDANISDFYLINKETHEITSRYRNMIFDQVIAKCKELNVHTIDLRKKFSNKYEYFFDDVHTNNQGSKAIGEFLYEELEPKFNQFNSQDFNFYEKKLFNIIDLSDKLIWSDSLSVCSSSKQIVTISFNIKCTGELKNNNALFSVSFNENMIINAKECRLIYSENVGNFQYIFTESNAEYRVSYGFIVPKDISNIRIGFRRWITKNRITLDDVKVFVQSIALQN